MYIDTITITGADDNVDRDALYDLSDKYPIVEWGLLRHPAKSGTPRYPSNDWCEQFDRYAPEFVSRSIHICGDAALKFCNGDLSIVRNSSFHSPRYERIQVNVPHGYTLEPGEIADLLIRSNSVIPTIVQMYSITVPIIMALIKKQEGPFV